MKFLLDENLPAWLAPELRKLDLDVVDIREVGHAGMADDLYPPTSSIGIVVVCLPRCSMRMVAEHVTRYLSSIKQSNLAGCLVVLEATRLRKRKLF